MNITFLVGNGFDRNLGLNTTYSDFVKVYKKNEASTETLKNFRDYIKDNEILWSDAEIALGQYTSQFKEGEAAAFSECHIDFCEHLATYLKEQERRIDYDVVGEDIRRAFSQLNNITNGFPKQECSDIDSIIKNHNAEERMFNFICFNYTETLDKCLLYLEQNSNIIGSHKHGIDIRRHFIKHICHVHGTVDKEMVFGVNDDSQISNPEIFQCEDGDIYKNMIIKKRANASYRENTDATAASLVENSSIIYVYGMSIGETDKLWWDRICTWLNKNPERHLILQNYELPSKGVVQTEYQCHERKLKRKIIGYSSLDRERRETIEKRIHIIGENIFNDIKCIADKNEKSNL